VLAVLGVLLPPISPSGSPQASLADSPFRLRKLPTAQVIDVGVSKPLLPWAWQELEQRSLTVADAARIMDGLDGWLQREHPAGYTEPLNWLDTFLDHLAQDHLVNDEQAIRFVVALHGSVHCGHCGSASGPFHAERYGHKKPLIAGTTPTASSLQPSLQP